MPDAILYCDRCGHIITPTAQGSAIIAKGLSVCGNCASALSPEERAKLAKKPTPVPAASSKRSTPRPSSTRVSSSRTAGTPSGSRMSPVFLAAGLGSGLLVGIAVSLSLVGGQSSDNPPATNAVPLTPPARVVTPTIATPVIESDQTKNDAPAETETTAPSRSETDHDPAFQLVGIKSRIDPTLRRYASVRTELIAFAAENEGAVIAAEAAKALEDLDARHLALAREEFAKAKTQAMKLASSLRLQEAEKVLASVRGRFGSGPWIESEGQKAIDEALAAVRDSRADVMTRLLAASKRALEDDDLDVARLLLSGRQTWPGRDRDAAARIIKDVSARAEALDRQKERSTVWKQFVLDFTKDGRRSIAGAEEALDRHGKALRKASLQSNADAMAGHVRAARLVESLAVDGLRASRRILRLKWKDRLVSGHVAGVKDRIVSIRPSIGEPVAVPLDELAPSDIVDASGLFKGEVDERLRAGEYLLVRGEYDLARSAIADLTTDAADTLEADLKALTDPAGATSRDGARADEFVSGLRGEYFAGVKRLATDLKHTRVDTTLEHDWKSNTPVDGLPKDSFSIRWSGQIRVPVSGLYAFSLRSDDGAMVRIADKVLLDATEKRTLTLQLDAELEEGWNDITVEFVERGGNALFNLRWHGPGFDLRAIEPEFLRTAASGLPQSAAMASVDSGANADAATTRATPDDTGGTSQPTAATLQAGAKSLDRKNVDVLALAAEYEDWDYANTTEYPPHSYRQTQKEEYGAPSERWLKGILHLQLPISAHTSWETGSTNDLTRHWRVAFKRPIKVGSLVGFMGPMEVSYLRAEVKHPGDILDDTHWTIVPEAGRSRPFRLVTFPPDVETTAVRFTVRLKEVPDPLVQPRILGVRILRERIVDWSPSSNALTSSEKEKDSAARLVDGGLDFHRLYYGTQWEAMRPQSRPLSPEDPEWAILKWRKPVLVSAVYLGAVFGKKVAVDLFSGEAEGDLSKAPPGSWREVAHATVPVWWRPPYTDFGIQLGLTTETAALRIRVIEPWTTEDEDIKGWTDQGRNNNLARIGEIMAFGLLGAQAQPAEELVRFQRETAGSPEQDGYYLTPAIIRYLGGIYDETKVRAKKAAEITIGKEPMKGTDAGAERLRSTFKLTLVRGKLEMVRLLLDSSAATMQRTSEDVVEDFRIATEMTIERGAIPIITTPALALRETDPNFIKIDKLNAMLLKLAKEMKVPFLDGWSVATRGASKGRRANAAVRENLNRLSSVLQHWVMDRPQRPLVFESDPATPRVTASSSTTTETTTPATTAGNLVLNGGFEQKNDETKFAEGWRIHEWGDAAATPKVRLDRTNPHGGTSAMTVLALQEGDKPGAFATVSLVPGTYSVAYWACADVEATARVQGHLGGVDLQSQSVGSDWKRFEAKVTIDEKQAAGGLKLWVLSSRVRVWFDDVEVRLIAAAR